MAKGQFLEAAELRKLASAKAGTVLPDEDADTLPIPLRDGERLVILVMYYPVRGRPGHRTISPPRYALHLDPTTGDVIRAWKTTPQELGIHQPTAKVPGFEAPAPGSWQAQLRDRERFLAMSNDIWAEFASRRSATDAALRPTLRKYWKLFQQITLPEEAPFYVQAAPEFFDWLRSAQ